MQAVKRARSIQLLPIFLLACLISTVIPLQNATAQEDTNELLRSPNLRVPKASSRTPLFWADGIMNAAQLEIYARAGFNTVIVRLFWAPTDDGSIVASDLEPQRDFARAAAALDLKIIYSLPPAPFGQEAKFRMSGQSGPYRVMWANWTQRAITQLKNTPNLIGWMLPDDPRALPYSNESSFSRWITTNYSTIEVLNSQWQTHFNSFEDVTLPATRQVVAAWRGPGKPPAAMTDVQMREYLQNAKERPDTQNFAFHPASLALANFQWDAYRTLLDFWAQTTRGADPSRVIFSGRLPDYAQLLSLPTSIDVSVPFLAPDQAEPDLASHNSQSIDIARRGGRFLVTPVLSTSISGTSPDVPARLVAAWADAALAHGSIGMGFDSWTDILQNRPLRRAILASIQRLKTPEYASLWGLSPASTSAVVLTPLADGTMLRSLPNNAGAPGPNGDQTPPPRGLYGFGEDMIEGEPTSLVAALRWGSAFGSTDFLSPDDLTSANSLSRNGVLKKYSIVFLPQAMSVPLEMAQELAGYVNGGGVIVSDLGLAATQNRGSAIGLSPEMRALFGVVPTKLQTLAFNLTPGEVHPLMPTWSAQASMRANALTAGNGPQGAAFVGPVAFGELMPGTVPLALAFQMPERLPGKDSKDPSDDIIRLQSAWLTLRPYGNGFAIFAPFRLWSNSWVPGQPGYEGFHGDLLARSATLAHVGVQSLTSQPLGTPLGTTAFVEAINYPNAIALLNHDAALQTTYGLRLFDSSSTSGPGLVDENGAPINGIGPGEMAIVPARKDTLEDAGPAEAGTTPTTTLEANRVPAITPAENPAITPLPELSPSPIPTPTPSEAPAAPTRIPSVQPSKPVIVQTSGAEYFLWSEAICVFPVGSVLPPTPGRVAPVEGAQNEFMIGNIVRPPMYHPLILHTYVPALEMKVLRAMPIRVQNTQGGPLAARVVEYNARQIALRVWPNSDNALPSGSSWRVALGKEGIVRVSIFDDKNGYTVVPGSRHFVAVTENAGEKGTVRATSNYILTADGEGKLNFELTGTLLGVLVRPALEGETGAPPAVSDPNKPQADVKLTPPRRSDPVGRDVDPGSVDFHKKYN